MLFRSICWLEVISSKTKKRFTVSHDELKGAGGSITFLRRKIAEVENGLILAPGTTVEKVVGAFEAAFGQAGSQKLPRAK